METKQIEYTKLKHAYLIVKSFLESEGYNKIKSLRSRIDADLGLSGADNLELLKKFVDQFELDYTHFKYGEHFHTEGELYNSISALINALLFPIWLPLKTIELLTLNKIKIRKPGFYKPVRPVKDLTFKDLVTWYIEKEYKPADSIRYQIKINALKM